jgi:hypothetical protein
MDEELDDICLPKKAVAKRYGSSTRTVDRWEADGTLPRGFYIKKRKFWRLKDLITRERVLVRTPKPPHHLHP